MRVEPSGVTGSFVVAFVCQRGAVSLAAKVAQEHDALYTTADRDQVAYWDTEAGAAEWLSHQPYFGPERPMYCRGRNIRAFVRPLTPEQVAALRLDGVPLCGVLLPGVEAPKCAPRPPVEAPFDPTPRRDKNVKHDKPVKRAKDDTPDWPGCVWRPVPAEGRVRYCPGGAPGLPRWASRRLVDHWRAADERYLEAVRPFSAEAGAPPHEGPCPRGCPHWGAVAAELVHTEEPLPEAEAAAADEAERVAAAERRRALLSRGRIDPARTSAERAPAQAMALAFGE